MRGPARAGELGSHERDARAHIDGQELRVTMWATNLPAASKSLSPVSAPRRKTSDIRRTDGSTPATCPAFSRFRKIMSRTWTGLGSVASSVSSSSAVLDRSDTWSLICSASASRRLSGGRHCPPIELPDGRATSSPFPTDHAGGQFPKACCRHQPRPAT